MKQLEFTFDCYTKTCGCLSHNGFLTRAGYRALDMAAQLPYLDKVDSVSALTGPRPIFVDEILEQQHRRFHSGS